MAVCETGQWEQWEGWFDALDDADTKKRDKAAKKLEAVKDPAILELVAELIEGTDGRSLHVMLQMAQRFGPAAAPLAPLLIELLGFDSHKRRKAAFNAIQAIGPAAQPALIEAFGGADNYHDFQSKLILDLLCLLDQDIIEVESPVSPDELGLSAIDELLVRAIEEGNTDVRLHALKLLGERKQVSAIPKLLSWLAPKAAQFAPDTFTEPGRIKYAAAHALGQMGVAAEVAIPTMVTWLQGNKLGDKRAAIEALGGIGTSEAIAHIVPFLRPVETESEARRRRSGKLQKSAIEALQKLASPDFLDRLTDIFLHDEAYPNSWLSLVDSIVDSVTKGLDPTAGFVWVRKLLQGEPGERLWYLLCALVNAWPDDDRPLLLSYIESHIDYWDKDLRRLDYRAADPCRDWTLWWPKMVHGEHSPAWALVRTVNIQTDYNGANSEPILSQLKSEYKHIESLTLSNFVLDKTRAPLLREANLPALRHLRIVRPRTTMHLLNQVIFRAPWLATLQSFHIGPIQPRNYSVSEGYQLSHPKGEALAQDPRVARFGLTLAYEGE